MRKVTYTIDDLEYFRELYKGVENIFEDGTSFRCEYTLIGNDYEERYLLLDPDGKKININDLNGYQKGVVLADCSRHFQGKPLESGGKMPTGCVKIEEVVL